jgi:hypothetical protein
MISLFLNMIAETNTWRARSFEDWPNKVDYLPSDLLKTTGPRSPLRFHQKHYVQHPPTLTLFDSGAMTFGLETFFSRSPMKLQRSSTGSLHIKRLRSLFLIRHGDYYLRPQRCGHWATMTGKQHTNQV